MKLDPQIVLDGSSYEFWNDDLDEYIYGNLYKSATVDYGFMEDDMFFDVMPMMAMAEAAPMPNEWGKVMEKNFAVPMAAAANFAGGAAMAD